MVPELKNKQLVIEAIINDAILGNISLHSASTDIIELMKLVKNVKLLYVDTDDTIALWDGSTYDNNLPLIEVETETGITNLYTHVKNIKLIEKFYKLGYGIIVWSQSGAPWARAVSKTVGIDDMVTSYLTKPQYIMDDLPNSAWMPKPIYRDPLTGENI